MPRFNYQCNDCAEDFEYLTIRSDDHPHCPSCASTNLQKKVSLFAIGNTRVKSPPTQKTAKKETAGHVCTSSCNHGPKKQIHSDSGGMHVGCGKAYAGTLRKKYGL